MYKSLILFAVAAVIGSSAQALENPQLVDSDRGVGSIRRNAQPGARNAGMQAVCREVFVDADEGYGVTRRETRVVCDETR